MDIHEDGGPIIKVIGKIRPSDRLDDGVRIVDCQPFWIQFGIVWPSFLNNFWLVNDACGIICVLLTWALVIYAHFVVFLIILFPSPYFTHSIINGLFFEFLAIFASTSHLKAMLSDPGAVPRGNAMPEFIKKMNFSDGQIVYKCSKCDSIKPERAHHCSVCKRCIRKMDHHCPWVNNCVGESNQKYFVLFTMYICLMSCHALYLSLFFFVTCISSEFADNCMNFSSGATTILIMMLIVEALMFGLFTAIMCCSQMSSICVDETGIEQLKRDRLNSSKNTWMSNMKHVFGHKLSFKWLSPFHPPTAYNFKADMYFV